jgi:thiol-disulfide isomerase/thioredoxin
MERGMKLVIIHKQYGDTISESELYHYMGIKYLLYPFKISGDTIFKYLDEHPPSRTYIDSLASGTLERSANLENIQDINGVTYTNKDLENNVIVLNFWARWCGPCIEELPELNKLVDSYQAENVLFFAPTLETGQDLDGFLSNREFKYKVVPRADKIYNSLKVFGLPTHVVINQNGIVKFIQIGTDIETIYEVLSTEIEKQLFSEDSL